MAASIIRSEAEHKVNTYTTSNQIEQSVTTLADGGWLVTWSSLGQDGSDLGIYQQRYDAAGTPVNGEQKVNTYTTNSQSHSSVIGLANGGWLVTWLSDGQDGDGAGTYQRLYDANGTAIGTETRVNTYTTGSQFPQDVKTLVDGGWLVTWDSYDQDLSSSGVYQQRYAANGNALGLETRVNTYTTSVQNGQSVTALANGGWVVNWRSAGQDGSGFGIYQQRYDSNGKALGGETKVNSYTTSDQESLVVTALADGGWVVTWKSAGQDGSGSGVYQQRYGANGNVLGSETKVNTYTASDQYGPRVTVLTDGGWLVTWLSNGQDGNGAGVFQQRYDANGNTLGNETRVNTFTTGIQANQLVAALADGGWVVTWASAGQDGSGEGVYQQRYDADGNACGSEMRVNDYTNSDQRSPSITALEEGSWLVTWISLNQDGSGYGIYQKRYTALAAFGDGKESGLGSDDNELFAVESGGLSAGDSLEAGSGIDTIKLSGASTLDLTAPDLLTGVEIVQGSGGSDVIITNAARLADIIGINGGAGSDVLRLKAGSYDLTGKFVSGIEMIELLGPGSVELADKSTALLVHSQSNDGAVILQGDVFTGAERQQLYNQGIRLLTDTDGLHVLQPVVATLVPGSPLQEGAKADTAVGGLTATDPNPNDGLSFALVDSAGGRFKLLGDSSVGYTIAVGNGALLDYEQATSHTLVVRVTDAGGLATDTAFTVSVSNVDPEKVTGTSAAETLKGGKGKDAFNGSGGNDRLWGGLGNDTLTGGTGKDAFVFDTKPSKSSNRDSISDLSVKDDSLWLDNTVFTKLGKAGMVTKPALLNKGFFALDKAKDTNDYLIYNRKTGVLSYDADGTGTKVKAVEIAVLTKKPVLTASDFFVV